MAKKRIAKLFFLPFLAAVPIILLAGFETRIVAMIGRTGWSIAMAIGMGVIVIFSLIPFGSVLKGFFGGKGGYSFFWGRGKTAQSILAGGRPATATLLAIDESSRGGTITINDQPFLNLRLQVNDGERPPYEISFDTIIPRTAVPQFQPGATFPVKVDAADPNLVVFDSGTQAGNTAADGKPTVGGEDWTEADNALLKKEGLDGMAKVTAVEDTGKSRNFQPLVRVSYEVFIPRQEPYTVTKDLAIPTHLVQPLRGVIGRSFPARIHPVDHTKMHIDITF